MKRLVLLALRRSRQGLCQLRKESLRGRRPASSPSIRGSAPFEVWKPPSPMVSQGFPLCAPPPNPCLSPPPLPFPPLLYVVHRFKPRALCMLAKHSISEQHLLISTIFSDTFFLFCFHISHILTLLLTAPLFCFLSN